MIDRRPALIARCLGAADVRTCVNFAREHSVTLSVKGGGHNISGLAVCDRGLMLDMSLMRGVWVDPIAHTARAQAGCLLGDVGTFIVQEKGKEPQTLPAGTLYREPIGNPMQAHNGSTSEATEILLMQIGHEGEPLMIKTDF
jgi:hypothetical protein